MRAYLSTMIGAFVLAAVVLPLPGRAPLIYTASRMFMPAEAQVLFGGDIMLDRTIRTTMEEKGGDFIFSCIDPILEKADLVVVNLEGPITSNPSKSVGTKVGGEGNYTFTFATSTAELLARHHIRLVNIGNNHIMNFGREGLNETKYFLSGAGVGYFGDPDPLAQVQVERRTVGGVPFSFVSWSDWTGPPREQTIAQVRAEADGGRIVVVYAHWGEEYISATKAQKILARSFVDAGASIVVGSHPHVVQEHEVYEGAHIYYSLGNLIFDQYWNDNVRRGLLLKVTFTREGIGALEEIPTYSHSDRRTCSA